MPEEFHPQQSVEWYSVPQLARTGVKAVISSIFGSFQDKREMQSALKKPDAPLFHDLSFKKELWIDYVADLGDGFDSTYSVAHALAREQIVVAGSKNYETQRGNVLIMGGDQVYPTASRDEYRNRLKGPYEAAFPQTGPKLDDETDLKKIMAVRPLLFAIPGNHDWYDGLSNFLKVFCQKRTIGNWKTVQDRSYFAIKLSEQLWLFGIDVQLDADIDTNQLQYFDEVLEQIPQNSRIILCTAEPAWIFTTRRKDHTYNNLAFFEEHCSKFKEKDLNQVLTLAGDLHHYARYSAGGRHKITSGGGGAFLHPTHNLPQQLTKLHEGGFRKEKVFPEAQESKKLVWSNLIFGFKNIGFAFFLGCVYLLMGWLLYLTSFRYAAGNADLPLFEHNFWKIFQLLLLNPFLLIMAILLVGGLAMFADRNPYNYRSKWRKGHWKFAAWGVAHGFSHLLLVVLTYWTIIQILAPREINFWPDLAIVATGMLSTGTVLGSTLFGIYLLISNLLVGIHDNEAFSSLKTKSYKNFIRLQLSAGKLTIYPIGIRNVPQWKKQGNSFTPHPHAPECILIEEPIEIDVSIPVKPILDMESSQKSEDEIKELLKVRISKPIAEIKQEYDVVVIGSGYGGSIAASRMARANRKVCVLEKGKEIRPGDYPNRNIAAAQEIQINTPKKQFGKESNLYDFRLNKNIHVFQGCGLGGTSLVNANVSLPPEARVFEDSRWPLALRNNLSTLWEGIKRAEEVLQPTAYPEASSSHYPKLNKLDAQRVSAKKTGGSFSLPPINVRFSTGLNSVGYNQCKCSLCGDCVTGCNTGAKNTTLMNYLPDAVNHGAEIFTEAAVSHLSQDEDGKWLIHYRSLNRGAEKFDAPEQSIRAGMVVLGAGSLGSTEILLRSRAFGLNLSDMIGKRFTGNGDVLAFSYNNNTSIDGIGLGHRKADSKRTAPGPCIAGIIDIREQQNLDDGMVIEEGVIPGALSAMMPKAFHSLSHLSGEDTDRGITDFMRERWAEIVSMLKGAYQGALKNTQTYLVMTHDDGQGQLKLENGNIRIDWPDVGKQLIFRKVMEKLKAAATANGGTFIKSPSWNKLMGYDLVTVHPLGGCVMGDTAETGVVNHKGQVFKGENTAEVYPNLLVLDGAIVPRSLGVNPLLTISGLAERNCKLVAEEMGWTINYGYGRVIPVKAKASQPVGISFTETMKGYISFSRAAGPNFQHAYDKGYQENNYLEFTLTVTAENLDDFLDKPEHQASLSGTVACMALSHNPLTVHNGHFQLFTPDKEKTDTLNMLYRMDLSSHEGETFRFEGYKEIHDDPGLDMWQDTTTLFVTLYQYGNKGQQQIAKGILKIEPRDFLKQMGTIKVSGAKSEKEELQQLYRFNSFFTQQLLNTYGGPLKKINLFNPDAAPRQQRDLRTGAPQLHPIEAKDGVPLLLSRYTGGTKGPVMLIHGLGVSSSIFSMDTIQTNLLEFLYEAGYDVWLLDNRVSIKLPSSHKPSSGDDVAANDYAPAIDHIRKISGKSSVHVVGHCYGGTTFCMAMLSGLKGVGSVVLSQVGPHMQAAAVNVLKSNLHLPGLLDKIGIDSLTAYTDSNESWQGKAFNYFLKFYPYDRDNSTANAVSNRITFMYGHLYELDQLNQDTLESLHEHFGVAHVESFKHLAQIIRNNKVVNAQGQDVYLPNLAKALALPVTIIHGEKNACFLPQGTKTTYETLKKLNPDIPYEHRIIPNYGHIDCIFGKNAHQDVYPFILKHLEDYAN